METITVGIDTEAASQTAVDWVIERARSTQTGIRLVTAFDMLASNVDKDGKVLAATRLRIEKAVPGTEVGTDLVNRSIMEELVEQSASSDLLVIGSHPHHRIRSALTGSFPVGLAARTECPIVIVPDDWSRGAGNVVVGVDYDESSDPAVLLAAREAARRGVDLDIVHVWGLTVPAVSAVQVFVEDPEATKEAHRQILEAAVERVSAAAPDLRVHAHLVQGIPAVELARRSARASLVVIGTHGWGPVTGLILGSVGQEVLHTSKVPVCIVPLQHAARPTVAASAKSATSS